VKMKMKSNQPKASAELVVKEEGIHLKRADP
jgi:hypothetical protein